MTSRPASRHGKGVFKRFWTPEEVVLAQPGRATKIVGEEIWREELEENQRVLSKTEATFSASIDGKKS
jgi:hypothetical protein